MGTTINKVANEVYKVLSSIYKVETFNSDGNRVYDYDDARNFYLTPGKIIVSILENGERHTIDVKLNKNVDIKDFENTIGQKLRKVATRNTNVSYNIRSYGREIKPKEENTMSIDNVQEGMYGTTRSSYQKVGECKVIIRHSGRVNEDKHGARSRHISAIFVETKNGERFKIAENNLHGARAMARHLSNGGSPFDTVGMKVTTMMSEMNELKGMILEARKITKGAITEQSTILIEQIRTKFLSIRESLKRMGGKVGYFRTTSSLTEGQIIHETMMSTDLHNDDGSIKYTVHFEYDTDKKYDGNNKPNVNITSARVVYDTDHPSNEDTDILSQLSDDELNILKNDAMKWEMNNYTTDKEYYNEDMSGGIHNNGRHFSTTFHSDKTDTIYNITFDYIIKPSPRNNGKYIIDIRNLMNDENVEMKSIFSSTDINDLKMEVIEYLRQKHHEDDKVAVSEELINEYIPSGGMQDLTTPWEDRDAWADAVLEFINRKIKLSTVRKPEHKHTQASALALLGMDDAARNEFFNIISSRRTNENINEEPMEFVSPLQKLGLKMADALEHPEKYKLEGAFSPGPADNGKMTDEMHERFNQMSSAIYKLENNDRLTNDEHKLALKFHNYTKDMNFPFESIEVSEEATLDTTKQVAGDQSVEINDVKIEDDAGDQIQDMADFARDKQTAGNYADVDDLFSTDEIKENSILEAWFDEAANIQFFNEEELIIEEEPAPVIEKTLPNTALHQLNLHMGNPLFNDLIAMYEGQGILDQVTELVEDDSKLKDEMNLSRNRLREFHEMDELSEAFKLLNELVSKNKMGSEDAIDVAAKKYAKEYHNGDKLAYEQASEALRQMAAEEGIIHADAGRTFADDVMSHSDEIRKHKDEIDAEQFYGDAHFEEMEEMEETIEELTEIPEEPTYDNKSEFGDTPQDHGDEHAYSELSHSVKEMMRMGMSIESAFIEASNSYEDEQRSESNITGYEPKGFFKDNALDLLWAGHERGDFDNISWNHDEIDEVDSHHVFAPLKDSGDDNKEQLDKDVSGPYVGEDESQLSRIQELSGIGNKNESIGRPQHGDSFGGIEPHEREFLDDEGCYTDQDDQAEDQAAAHIMRMQELAAIDKQIKTVQEYNNNNDDDEDEWGTKKDYNSKYGKKQKRREMRQKKEYKRTDHMDEQNIFNNRVIELSKYKT